MISPESHCLADSFTPGGMADAVSPISGHDYAFLVTVDRVNPRASTTATCAIARFPGRDVNCDHGRCRTPPKTSRLPGLLHTAARIVRGERRT
jgi:hypothetical protein